MNAFTFTYAENKNELLVGTTEDITEMTGQAPEQTFDTVDTMIESMNAFRSREIIITLVSENEALQKLWNEPYVRKINHQPRSSTEDS